MKTFILVVLVACGCGDNLSVPVCEGTLGGQLCPGEATATCQYFNVDGSLKPAVECVVRIYSGQAQSLVPALCVATCD